MRKADAYLLAIALLGAGLLALLLVHPILSAGPHERGEQERRLLAQRLGLTDLCLFTEARYTRHPSQADLHAAFQDHPMAIEHFPSGSLVAPPAHLTAPDRPMADGPAQRPATP